MRRTQLLQEVRKMRFEEAYEGWQSGRLTQEEAARLLGVCDRTFRRYIARYEEEGLEGLVDRRLRQVSHRKAPVDEVMALVERYRSRHMGWNVKHFHAWYQREGGKRSYTWVKNRLQEAGVVEKAPGRGKHRKRRERAAWPGMLLHQDGSRHEWVPGQYYQDRLPKELAAAGITDMAAANRYLKEVYMPAFNAEFMQPAQEEGSAFVAWIGDELDDFLCEQYERVVGKDNCVAFEGLKLQIPPDRYRMHYVKVKVRVHRYLDGRLAIFHGPRRLARYTADGQLQTPELQVVA